MISRNMKSVLISAVVLVFGVASGAGLRILEREGLVY